MENLTFYFAPGSSSMAVHIALQEIGVPFDAKSLSFTKGDMRTPAFRQINPEGKVPTLLIDGHVLTEVAAILYYLARRFPDASLWPEGLEDEAQVISWMSFIASTLHPARTRGIEHAMAVWGLADARLGDRSWAIGRYTIADIHLFRLYWRFANSAKPTPGTFPHLAAHHARMLQRPAVQRTLASESAIGYELPA